MPGAQEPRCRRKDSFSSKIACRSGNYTARTPAVGRFSCLSFVLVCAIAASATAVEVQIFHPVYALPDKAAEPAHLKPTRDRVPTPQAQPASEFKYRDRTGRILSAPVVASPLAKIDPRLNPTLIRAASIAQDRARAHSKSRCWRYVKNALLASGAISSYPKTAYAKEAGAELVRDFGFKKLPIRDPYAAPVGAVIVYGSRRAAGHVEIRTKTGFVSDFQNKKPSRRPLIGIYAKA